jgi:hypothetical protein
LYKPSSARRSIACRYFMPPENLPAGRSRKRARLRGPAPIPVAMPAGKCVATQSGNRAAGQRGTIIRALHGMRQGKVRGRAGLQRKPRHAGGVGWTRVAPSAVMASRRWHRALALTIRKLSASGFDFDHSSAMARGTGPPCLHVR